ncbi:glutathione S-transferase family protein [Denitrobaculum tricleocarpae]|uniref:Glutathione S-transferase family protein n=1 Tax=Denitrobaculum tricleocarpae TaxID=2591009 RepID=A0A545U223_9PROT|nr:glutathione S-transferase family protein [Denitrobaculum tricleocarpae]TQV83527.1 glutathione S-transferase family protein [Denitrobaculum tricleocarpae]
MGLLVDGVWHDKWYDTSKSGGRFKRNESIFRNWVTADGEAGPSGRGGFKAEPDRYHLYVSLACPWAHRTLIFRALKGLEDAISVSVVHWHMGEHGWEFGEGEDCTGDTLGDARYLHQIYTRAVSDYSGRVTVPILWDKKTGSIVSNESSEIIRMLNSAFAEVTDSGPDFYPETLREEIDAVNERVYHTVNNGVYKCGFATSQEAYDEAFTALFDSMAWLEDRLSRQRYLVGDRITEADWRLFTTMVRFDPVYVGHFKCNKWRLAELPNLWGHTRELFQIPGIAETVNLHHIKQHYFGSHPTVNPTGIVPQGPEIDFHAPHQRAVLTA